MNDKQRAAMQMAKEALERMICNGQKQGWNDNYSSDMKLSNKAITALREALERPQGEPVAKVIRNESGQIAMQKPDGSYFDMSKHIGQTFYTTPPSVEAAIEATKKKAANLAYAVCAETRHVTLGDKIAAAIRSMK